MTWPKTARYLYCEVTRTEAQGYYSQVYRLKTVRPQDNMITEAHPLNTWQIIEDGHLTGFKDTGSWYTYVELNTDE